MFWTEQKRGSEEWDKAGQQDISDLFYRKVKDTLGKKTPQLTRKLSCA